MQTTNMYIVLCPCVNTEERSGGQRSMQRDRDTDFATTPRYKIQ